jgi:hypothetical protein
LLEFYQMMGEEKYTYKFFKRSNVEKFGNSPPNSFREISLHTSQVTYNNNHEQ